MIGYYWRRQMAKSIEHLKTPVGVPDKCLICGARYIGGHATPKEAMSVGLRVWYECGAVMSIKPDAQIFEDTYYLKIHNCSQGEEAYG